MGFYDPNKVSNDGLEYNMMSKARPVNLENGFILYKAKYEDPVTFGIAELLFAASNDEEAIDYSHRAEPRRMRCIFVLKVIIREKAEPSTIIIWGN